MKRIIALLMMVCTIGVTAFAQTVKEKVKKTSTFGQKVHNTFSRHKHYNGYKVKRAKEVNGRVVKEKKKIVTDKN